ncbi:MAG: cell division protein FtsQ/DivIB [Pseudomonadota bacterium]
MRSLNIDPGSRFGYRMQRLWLTPLFRLLLRIGLPFALVGGIAYAYLSQAHVQEVIELRIAELRASIQERPEFMVQLMAIEGAAPEVAEAIRDTLHLDFPASSFDLPLEDLRAQIETLPAVRGAALRVRPGGVLEVTVEERRPVLVWRSEAGLTLLDIDGVSIRPAAQRSDHATLPLVVGKGADQAVEEAMRLFQAATPVQSRLRGLRRMGERRWDVVLDRGQVIMLPEDGAVSALERVILLDTAQELLARDITHVDLRNPRRPTLRLAERSLEELRQIKDSEFGVPRNE